MNQSKHFISSISSNFFTNKTDPLIRTATEDIPTFTVFFCIMFIVTASIWLVLLFRTCGSFEALLRKQIRSFILFPTLCAWILQILSAINFAFDTGEVPLTRLFLLIDISSTFTILLAHFSFDLDRKLVRFGVFTTTGIFAVLSSLSVWLPMDHRSVLHHINFTSISSTILACIFALRASRKRQGKCEMWGAIGLFQALLNCSAISLLYLLLGKEKELLIVFPNVNTVFNGLKVISGFTQILFLQFCLLFVDLGENGYASGFVALEKEDMEETVVLIEKNEKKMSHGTSDA